VAAIPLEPFTRVTPPAALPAELVEQVFNTEPAAGTSAPAGEETQVIVVQVTSATPLGPDAMASESAAIDQALEVSLAKDMTEYFARAVVNHHEAWIEPGVIDDVFSRLGGSSGAPGQQY